MTERDVPRFDPSGADRVFEKIAEDIAAKIADGTYPSGGRLPSLGDLVHEYGAARETIRKAVGKLAEQGILRIVQGKGTFIVGAEDRTPPD